MRRPSRQGQSAVLLRHSTVAVALSSLLLALPAAASYGQSLNDGVNHYFEAVSNGEYSRFPEVDAASSAEVLADFYDTVVPRLTGTDNDDILVKLKAYELIGFVASHVHDIDARAKGVHLLMNACAEHSFRVRSRAVDLLTRFTPSDFQNAAKDTLRKLVRSEAPPLDRFIKLAGFVGIDDLQAVIKPFSYDGYPAHLRWAALVALARLGNRSALDGIMQRVRRIPVNDDVVYQLFPDLIYTRQPEAIAYIIEALQSNAKNCRSADAERDVAIPCGYRIMEQLAPVVTGFPLTLDESGDLDTDDYPAALQEVRTWFNDNKYWKIRKDTY